MNYGYGIIEGEERKMKGYEMRWGGCIKSRKERRKGTTAQYIYKKKKGTTAQDKRGHAVTEKESKVRGGGVSDKGAARGRHKAAIWPNQPNTFPF